MELAKANVRLWKLKLWLVVVVCSSFEIEMVEMVKTTHFKYCDGKGDKYAAKVNKVKIWPLPGGDMPWILNVTFSDRVPTGKPFNCDPLLLSVLVRYKDPHSTGLVTSSLCLGEAVKPSRFMTSIDNIGGPGMEFVPQSMRLWLSDVNTGRNKTCILLGKWAHSPLP